MSKNNKNNNKDYNAQISSFNQNRISFNPFSKNLNQNDYQRGQNQAINNSSNQRYTVAAPFPSDSLFDLNSTNSVLGFIQTESKNVNNPSIDIIPRNTISNNDDIYSEKYKKIKRAPLDEISLNSNNRNIQSRSPINSGNTKSQNNMRSKILNKDNYHNLNKNISNKSFNNNNNLLNKSSNLNNNIINRINNQKFQNLKKDNYNNINNSQIQNNNKDQNNNRNIQIERAILQNQFANRNLAMSSMLKKINFFENLNKIGQKRMKIFEKEFQKEIFFMKKDSFDNVFINQYDIDKYCPLTLIFHFIFNPKNKITQFPYKKSFYESIFQLQGCKNIKISYNQNELKEVPKYFDDFNYVNDLFNNFNEKDLNLFINEIEHWKKTFSYELKYTSSLKINEGQKEKDINDVVKVYFVSPNDLIVDYHSYHKDNYPISDSFVSISQYNFHCDIKFDRNRGRFAFGTSAIVYNKIQMKKRNIIQNDINESLSNENKVEFVENIWNRLLNVIREESNKNKIISDKIFKDHIRQTLNKYSKNKPQQNYDEENNKNKKDNIMKNNNINFNKNNDQIFKKINQKVEKQFINDENLEENFQSKNMKNINNKIENKINNHSENINNLNDKDNEILKDNINNIGNIKDDIKQVKPNYQDNKKNEMDKLNKNKRNKIIGKTNTDMIEEENPYLFYGVLATFFLFIFKTILGIENGNISMEIIFNFIIIIIIGFMLIKNHIIDNNN